MRKGYKFGNCYISSNSSPHFSNKTRQIKESTNSSKRRYFQKTRQIVLQR